MICRRAHVTRGEIGAIRVFDRESRFEIAAGAAERVRAALAAEPTPPGEPRIVPLDEAPPLPPRERRPAPHRGGNDGGRASPWAPTSDAVGAPAERPRGARPSGKAPYAQGGPRSPFANGAGKTGPRPQAAKRGPQRRG